jgi:predicted transcriptional regulator
VLPHVTQEEIIMNTTKGSLGIENALTSKLEKELDILKRHIQILKIIKREEPIGIIRLSEITGFPHHKVRYSLRILEDEGIIEPSVEGAIILQKTDDYLQHFLTIITKMLTELAVIKEELTTNGKD